MFNIPFCWYKKNQFVCYVVPKFCCLSRKKCTSRVKHKGIVPCPNLEMRRHNHFSLSLSPLQILGKYLMLTFTTGRVKYRFTMFSLACFLSVCDDEVYIVSLHIKITFKIFDAIHVFYELGRILGENFWINFEGFTYLHLCRKWSLSIASLLLTSNFGKLHKLIFH